MAPVLPRGHHHGHVGHVGHAHGGHPCHGHGVQAHRRGILNRWLLWKIHEILKTHRAVEWLKDVEKFLTLLQPLVLKLALKYGYPEKS